mmetsp:Transcript_45342/g.134172  ORF Transcript_45342/g.134172 Transcript_45342/m.134172 type:complete len:271 (-) Transcript_45342:945-1757(-)
MVAARSVPWSVWCFTIRGAVCGTLRGAVCGAVCAAVRGAVHADDHAVIMRQRSSLMYGCARHPQIWRPAPQQRACAVGGLDLGWSRGVLAFRLDLILDAKATPDVLEQVAVGVEGRPIGDAAAYLTQACQLSFLLFIARLQQNAVVEQGGIPNGPAATAETLTWLARGDEAESPTVGAVRLHKGDSLRERIVERSRHHIASALAREHDQLDDFADLLQVCACMPREDGTKQPQHDSLLPVVQRVVEEATEPQQLAVARRATEVVGVSAVI